MNGYSTNGNGRGHNYTFVVTGLARDGIENVVEDVDCNVETASARDKLLFANYHFTGSVVINGPNDGSNHFDLSILHRRTAQVPNAFVIITAGSVDVGNHLVQKVKSLMMKVTEIGTPGDVRYPSGVEDLFRNSGEVITPKKPL